MWYKNNHLYKPEDKGVTDVEKCVNLIVTRWQRQNGITPIHPVATAFDICPKCGYNVPLSTAAESPCSKDFLNAFAHMMDVMEEKQKEIEQEENSTITEALTNPVSRKFLYGTMTTEHHVVPSKSCRRPSAQCS